MLNGKESGEIFSPKLIKVLQVWALGLEGLGNPFIWESCLENGVANFNPNQKDNTIKLKPYLLYPHIYYLQDQNEEINTMALMLFTESNIPVIVHEPRYNMKFNLLDKKRLEKPTITFAGNNKALISFPQDGQLLFSTILNSKNKYNLDIVHTNCCQPGKPRIF